MMSFNRLNSNKNKGQVIVAGMALMLVTGVMLFFVFNSSRAVNEKINLVNAADAAAYSGAQVAARQLNFIAYTNRAMIANEVAVGHMVSFQAEVNMVANTLGSGISGLGVLPYTIIIDAGLSFIGTSREQIMDVWTQGMTVLTGTYILATDATNAMYSEFQEQEYMALAGKDGAAQSAVNAAMSVVANEYVKHSDVSISVNEESLLVDISSATEDSKLKALAQNALTNIELCTLVMFAKPGNTGPPRSETEIDNADKKISQYCTNPASPNGLSPLHESNLVDDSGALLSMLTKSTDNSSSADWINDRNMDYSLATRDVSRTGSTEVEWDAGAEKINWVAASDKVRSDPGFLGVNDLWIKIDGEGSADASTTVDQSKNNAPWLSGTISSLLGLFGVCDSIDCGHLSDEDYQGGHNYAFVNPAKETATVYAFLNQEGNCNDLLGRDDETKEVISGWIDDQPRYGTNCNAESLQAVSTAEVFYQRPGCESDCVGFDSLDSSYSVKPNLYNPFWQARLSVKSLVE